MSKLGMMVYRCSTHQPEFITSNGQRHSTTYPSSLSLFLFLSCSYSFSLYYDNGLHSLADFRVTCAFGFFSFLKKKKKKGTADALCREDVAILFVTSNMFEVSFNLQ